MKSSYFLLTVMVTQVSHVCGHGFLRDPAQRSSAWKYGYNTPINYNHNQLFCGGVPHQWSKGVDGRCGVCGDPWGEHPEPNADINGKYVKNIITGRYRRGGIMNTTVHLTANHKGWFEFRLCRLKDDKTKVTQACLNENLLFPVETTSSRTVVKKNQNIYNVSLQLPAHIKCDHCVLQWKYNTGNSYGCEKRHGVQICGIGLGNQETFVNCADIQITDDKQTIDTPDDSIENMFPGYEDSYTGNYVTNEGMYPGYEDSYIGNYVTNDDTVTTTEYPGHAESNEGMYPGYNDDEDIQDAAFPKKMKCEGSGLVCSVRARSLFAKVPGMDEWCCNNCVPKHCPEDLCSCDIIYE